MLSDKDRERLLSSKAALYKEASDALEIRKIVEERAFQAGAKWASKIASYAELEEYMNASLQVKPEIQAHQRGAASIYHDIPSDSEETKDKIHEAIRILVKARGYAKPAWQLELERFTGKKLGNA